jgi:hypothetical protein
MLNTTGGHHAAREKTYEVRLRFWRARGLLSTSGGCLFATVSGECTRNAKSVATGLARLPIEGDATGRGEEADMANNSHNRGWVEGEFKA